MVAVFMVTAATVLSADSASAPLTVGARVVRSCVVRATPIDRGTARLELACASGASSVNQPGGPPQGKGAPSVLRLQLPTSPYRGESVDDNLEVVTVNF